MHAVELHQRILTAAGLMHGHAAALEAHADQRPMLGVVIHHQDAHGPTAGRDRIAQGHRYGLHSGNIERCVQ